MTKHNTDAIPLAALQQQMADALTAGHVDSLNPAVMQSIVAGDFLPRDRFSVHVNNVRISLQDCIVSSFPVTASFIGEDFLLQVARDFVREQKPVDPRLSEYGQLFVEFWHQYEKVADYQFIGDMLNLELSLEKIHALPFSPPMGAEGWQFFADHESQLAQVVFTLSPAYKVIKSQWPLLDLWSLALEMDGNEENADAMPDMEGNAQTLLMINTDGQVYLYPIEDEVYQFIQALENQGGHFVKAIDSVCGADNNEELIESLLSPLAMAGLFIDIKVAA